MRIIKSLSFFIFLFLSSVLFGANYTLDIINIDEVGDNHRIKHQYTGIQYDVRIAAKGGLYPFTWELITAPSGMTIDSSTGQITWSNPTTGNHAVTVKVTDAENNTDQESYPSPGLQVIEDTNTDPTQRRFHFLDAVNGNDSTGNGTLATPWKTMGAIYTNHTTEQYPNDLVYFRAGTYSWPNVHSDSGRPKADLFVGGKHIIGFLGYPNETVYITGDDSDDGQPPTHWNYAHLDYLTDAWFSNIEFIDHYQYVIGPYPALRFTFYDTTVTDFRGGGSGSNSAVLVHGDNTDEKSVIVGNTFNDLEHQDEYAIVLYDATDFVIEDNIQYGDWGRFVGCKCDTNRIFIRHNQILPDGTEYPRYGIQVMHCIKGTVGTWNTEISFNFFKGTDRAIFSSDCCGFYDTGPGFVFRNTIYDFNVANSDVWYRSYQTDSGIETIYANVIINSDPEESGTPGTGTWYKDKCKFDTMTAAAFNSLFSFSDNLLGVYADNIVNSGGLLQGTYRTNYLGTHGWETGQEAEKIITGGIISGGNIR